RATTPRPKASAPTTSSSSCSIRPPRPIALPPARAAAASSRHCSVVEEPFVLSEPARSAGESKDASGFRIVLRLGSAFGEALAQDERQCYRRGPRFTRRVCVFFGGGAGGTGGAILRSFAMRAPGFFGFATRFDSVSEPGAPGFFIFATRFDSVC